MRLLAIESSGDLAGVAVVDECGVLAEVAFRHRLELSRFLAVRIEETLALAGLTVEAIEGIGVGVGPGSFTGLRLGVTAAKTLAFARGIPAGAVGTLEALAWEHPAPESTLVCAVLGASAGELFAGCYRWREGGPSLEGEEALQPAAELAARLSAGGDVLVVGSPGPHRDLLRGSGGRVIVDAEDRGPRAATIARLARQRLQAGEVFPVHALAPRYLRASAAEVRREARPQ